MNGTVVLFSHASPQVQYVIQFRAAFKIQHSSELKSPNFPCLFIDCVQLSIVIGWEMYINYPKNSVAEITALPNYNRLVNHEK